MSFIIGRGRYARETYPDTGGSSDTGLARNSAYGPAAPTDLVAGSNVAVPWQHIEHGGGSGIHVAITPKVTGIVRVIAMVGVENTDGIDPGTVNVRVAVNDVENATLVSSATVDSTDDGGNGVVEIPFLIELNLPVGVTSNISILALLATGVGQSTTVQLDTDLCSIDLEELSIATG